MSSADNFTCLLLPYLTAALPGVGGLIKRHDEDFLVEEVPLYEASGQGTHTYFELEKRGLTTLEAVRRIARALGRRQQDVGYAGLKDAHGVTRQMMSVEHVDPQRVADLSLPQMRVLRVDRHTNKLKLGHLAGNRFLIKIRDVGEGAAARAQPILDMLVARGVPNYFGPQRFGARGDNARIGRAALRGDYEEALALILGRPGPADHGVARRARVLFDAGRVEEAATAWSDAFREQARLCRAWLKASGDAAKAWRAVNHTLRKLYVSAFQSELFNRALAERIDGIDVLEVGDMAWKHRNGACFRVEDAEAEQPRCDAWEISPTGPLFGVRMTPATHRPGERERRVLAAAEVALDRRRTPDGIRIDGARRPLRVPPGAPVLAEGTDDLGLYLQVAFTLPSGAYATCVTREACKIETRPPHE